MFKIDPNKNPRVKKKLQALLGSTTDLSNFAVFEARANDTLPITGAGGFLKGARMSLNYLTQMQDAVLSGQYVPIIKLHNQSESLPEGRIFDAAVFKNKDDDSQHDLHIMFYLEQNSELTTKTESGIIAEMSTGTTPNSLCCSSCGYDFLASEDNRRNLYRGRNYTPLCPNGHQWATGGNHLTLSSVGKWKETSIVTRGAVDRAKILGAEHQLLANLTDEINLSADNNNDMMLEVTLTQGDSVGFLSPEAHIKFTGSPNMTDVNLSQDRYEALVRKEVEASMATEKLNLAESAKAELETKLQAAQAEVDRLADIETQLSEKTTAHDALQTQVTELETKLAAATTGAGNRGVGVDGGDQNAPTPIGGLDLSYYQTN